MVQWRTPAWCWWRCATRPILALFLCRAMRFTTLVSLSTASSVTIRWGSCPTLCIAFVEKQASRQPDILTKERAHLAHATPRAELAIKYYPLLSLSGCQNLTYVTGCDWEENLRTALGDSSPAFYQRLTATIPMLSFKFLLSRWRCANDDGWCN